MECMRPKQLFESHFSFPSSTWSGVPKADHRTRFLKSKRNSPTSIEWQSPTRFERAFDGGMDEIPFMRPSWWQKGNTCSNSGSFVVLWYFSFTTRSSYLANSNFRQSTERKRVLSYLFPRCPTICEGTVEGYLRYYTFWESLEYELYVYEGTLEGYLRYYTFWESLEYELYVRWASSFPLFWHLVNRLEVLATAIFERAMYCKPNKEFRQYQFVMGSMMIQEGFILCRCLHSSF
ncbi:LOW QUALITY PROTEIN: hypothetical protein HID58_029165 [Brassica napus]|uniref:Uncharacterized protein n=1 Tax=Brassica napus TaxID=3708 RepID=A0ABQ8CCB9_BRANA|nr:LOW QUALITY PROTEIN: hypothetical protein HID58_029165 [Brassica napus]